MLVLRLKIMVRSKFIFLVTSYLSILQIQTARDQDDVSAIGKCNPTPHDFKPPTLRQKGANVVYQFLVKRQKLMLHSKLKRRYGAAQYSCWTPMTHEPSRQQVFSDTHMSAHTYRCARSHTHAHKHTHTHTYTHMHTHIHTHIHTHTHTHTIIHLLRLQMSTKKPIIFTN
jgi:hypothetical protein